AFGCSTSRDGSRAEGFGRARDAPGCVEQGGLAGVRAAAKPCRVADARPGQRPGARGVVVGKDQTSTKRFERRGFGDRSCKTTTPYPNPSACETGRGGGGWRSPKSEVRSPR